MNRNVMALARGLGLLLLLFPMPLMAAGLELAYTVSLDSLAAQTLSIELIVTGWEQEELRLRSVPTYMDNPTAAARGEVVRDLAAWTTTGTSLAVESAMGEDGETIFTISDVPDTLRLVYDLRVDFVSSQQTDDYPIQLPYMDRERAWLYGNYVFCQPELARRQAMSVRKPARIEVRFSLPGDIPLVGVPSEQLEVSNVYALMSLQFGLGSFLVEEGTTAQYPFRIVTPDSASFTLAERAWLRERTGELVTAVTGIFGGAPFPTMSFYYFRGPGTGGLEGAYACQTYAPAGVDLTDPSDDGGAKFALTALHEFFHTWNPIGLFAADDPWFKEGVTCYYGEVLADRLGWQPPDAWQQWLVKFRELLAQNPLIDAVALTDPRIWEREYDSEAWRTLTYDRGQAVTLLLDVKIREATLNRKSLDDLLPLLFRRHLHDSFSHTELLAAIQEATGFDATDFFACYVEGTTPPAEEEVARALDRAVELGVFTPRR